MTWTVADLTTTARATSAVPLTAEEQARLKTSLKQRFGRDLALALSVDPGILGGIVVQVGDVVIDGSLAGKLDALQEQLLRGGG
ncbi:MAG: ATP synthase F1 subunit delta [Chloroflexi bacterium]|nr:ATP synthase F1 subunit delta [Chloroflexota bacterium]MBU1748315.1 ATP synthase F1 subunit delta [Chloroflexota bacterium]MBU1878512.1 ATP synthase F1 subunit delta [Chloroflexota bacterium]